MTDKMDDDGNYEVGYRKPPKASRFKPGQSGNPRGRPKNAQNVGKLLAAALAQRITIREGERTAEVSKREALIVALLNRAIKGDGRATAQVLGLIQDQDRGEAETRQEGVTINVIDRFDDSE
ncbi:DUF5681 domain-containing protein [Seohaeicola zhoushanensis]|uniref:DUF5681 domain-containing protein n=1 Tax=Seohaeicola zhoushanensis TaxID=1569283 RepID=A0A8J3H2T4_9RHOB|nr:DUF5681 domain-containing protein [Seohaeicola zhoushanensis]GHF70712.1 hypothetical protein GCM10017056_47120 [Seohaeicola zhoushanensis]